MVAPSAPDFSTFSNDFNECGNPTGLGTLTGGVGEDGTSTAFSGVPGSEEAVANQVSILFGAPLELIEVFKTDVPKELPGGVFAEGQSDSNFTALVGPGIFFTKYGNWRSYFSTDTEQMMTFTKEGDGPAGISNFGTVNIIPLPAAGWLLLGGLGTLAAFRRRARKAA